MDNIMSLIIERLRGAKKNPSEAPQARGYQLYAAEAQANGETPLPYQEWVKTATPLDSSY